MFLNLQLVILGASAAGTSLECQFEFWSSNLKN